LLRAPIQVQPLTEARGRLVPSPVFKIGAGQFRCLGQVRFLCASDLSGNEGDCRRRSRAVRWLRRASVAHCVAHWSLPAGRRGRLGRVARAQLGDRDVERRKLSEHKLGRGPRSAPVGVDHDARLVAGAVGDPSLRLAVRQVDRDERGAKIVKPHAHALIALLVEVGAIDARNL
jgi:hypothetical protein